MGATGGTGRLIVSEALARGYDVNVLVRSAEQDAGLTGSKLIVGDVREESALRAALAGRDAVISTLGPAVSPFREVTLLSTATRALVSAMKQEHVSRLICITGMGAGDSAGHGGFLMDKLIFPLLLRHVYADTNRQESVVKSSGLDWVLVRPSVLNDKPSREVRAITDLRLSWRHHLATRRRTLCPGPTSRRHLAAPCTAYHVVGAGARGGGAGQRETDRTADTRIFKRYAGGRSARNNRWLRALKGGV